MHVTMFKLKTAAGATCDEGTGHLRQYEDLDSLKTQFLVHDKRLISLVLKSRLKQKMNRV